MGENIQETPKANKEDESTVDQYSTVAIQQRFDEYKKALPDNVKKNIRVNFYFGPGGKGKELQLHLESKIGDIELLITNPPKTFDEFLARFDLIGNDFPRNLLQEAYKDDFVKDVKKSQRFIYWSFTLREAKNLILEELPEMRELSDQLETKVSFWDIDDGEMNEDDFSQHPYAGGFMGNGNSGLIAVPKFKRYEQVNSYQMIRTLQIAHEFFHIINSHYAKENFGFSQSNELITDRHYIFTTLLESTSISLEYLLLKRLAALPNNEQLEKTKKFGVWRVNNVLELAKFKHEKPRTTVTEIWNGEEGAGENWYYERKTEPLFNFPGLNYSEGAKLAIQLQRNGWTAHDIPELWKKIKVIIDELIAEKKIVPAFSGSKPFDIYTELAQYGKYATWSNLKERLLQLHPERN